MDSNHPDFSALNRIRQAIATQVGGPNVLADRLPTLVREALDYVIDPVATARTSIADLDNVEKTFVGLKVEHFLRDFLDVPKGVRDLKIDELDVDVKNTVGKTWMIPKETYSADGPCLLILIAEDSGHCSLGLILARSQYLNAPNRDKKRSVKSHSRDHDVLWLADRLKFPSSHWAGLDMARFRELRKIKAGSLRAATFFEENIGRVVHRRVVESLLFDQSDYMKRLRSNGGAKDLLDLKQILLFNGSTDAAKLERRGLPPIGSEEWVSVRG
jgi:hypothetical protein